MLYNEVIPTTNHTHHRQMAGSTAPLAIGTRGTVGSLLRREIEYFQRLEHDPFSKKNAGMSKSSNADTHRSKTTLSSLLMISWRKQRKRSSSYSSSGSSSFLSGEEFDGMPGFSYKNLKADIGRIDL